MNFSCPNCGSLNVQDHATIIEQGISFTTHTDAFGGTYTTRYQSPLSEQLSAGEPGKGSQVFNCLIILYLIGMLSFLFLFVPTFILSYLPIPNGSPLYIMSFVAIIVVGLIVLLIVMSIVSKVRTKRYNQKHKNWLNLMRRRYYCLECGYQFQS